jgi:hypothetical protein
VREEIKNKDNEEGGWKESQKTVKCRAYKLIWPYCLKRYNSTVVEEVLVSGFAEV